MYKYQFYQHFNILASVKCIFWMLSLLISHMIDYKFIDIILDIKSINSILSNNNFR